MKPAYLFAVVISAFIPSMAIAVHYDGNLVLGSQNDVDTALIYTSVSGSLVVSGPDIHDLSPLSGIESVGSYIVVDHNPGLTSVVDGFDSLTNVGGGIFFYYNDSLVTFSGFDELLQTGDNIDFWFNSSLESVSGFKSLHTAGWSLEFGGSPLLTKIPEFNSLQTINSSLFILDNTSLAEITGFRNLQYVDWSFQIQGNSSLGDLCGFYNYFVTSNSLYTGNGAFDIVDNGTALPNPTTIQDLINAGHCAKPFLVALQDQVISLDLARGIERKLTNALDAVLAALDCGISCASLAVAELEEFKAVAERQRGKKLTDTVVDQLITEADTIISLIA